MKQALLVSFVGIVAYFVGLAVASSQSNSPEKVSKPEAREENRGHERRAMRAAHAELLGLLEQGEFDLNGPQTEDFLQQHEAELVAGYETMQSDHQQSSSTLSEILQQEVQAGRSLQDCLGEPSSKALPILVVLTDGPVMVLVDPENWNGVFAEYGLGYGPHSGMQSLLKTLLESDGYSSETSTSLLKEREP